MNGKDLSRQLGDLPEEMIAEAMVPAKRLHRKQSTRRLLRFATIAAVLAMLLTALSFWPAGEDAYVTSPLVLRVYGYSLAEDNTLIECELTPGLVEQAIPSYGPLMNIVEGLPLTFSFPNEGEYTAMIRISHGYFIDGRKDITPDGKFVRRENKGVLGECVELDKTRTIYIPVMYADLETGETCILPDEDVYVEVIVYSENNIVGFAVLEVYRTDPQYSEYSTRMLDSASFPKVDGEYQQVSQEYVDTRIRKAEK